VTIPPDQQSSTKPDWDQFRRQMPVAERWAYIDHAAVAPISGPAQQAIARWGEQAAREGDTIYPEWMEKLESLRSCTAAMVGAEPEEIALVPNTTSGITLIAEGLPWEPGDNVVTRDDEFPSNQYPWLNLADRGVETRRVPTEGGKLDLNRLADACDERTRIITISWVAFANGWRHDVAELAELAHDQGALFFLDAIQGLGVYPLDVKQAGVDFLAADGHKWLLGPEGAGVFYVRREHLDWLRPLGVGWNSVKHSSDFSRIELDLRDTAVRYEGGTPNTPGFIGLDASVRLLTEFGMEAISSRVNEISDLACQRLTEIGAKVLSHRDGEHRSGIVAFDPPHGDPEAARQACFEQGVALSCRGGRLRISPHAYNDASDIERLIDVLR